MKLEDVLSILPIHELKNISKNIHISGVKMDHRLVEKGDLFVCIKGFTVDGHQFARAALERGAISVVCEREIDKDAPMIVVPNTTRALALIANKFFNYPTKS